MINDMSSSSMTYRSHSNGNLSSLQCEKNSSSIRSAHSTSDLDRQYYFSSSSSSSSSSSFTSKSERNNEKLLGSTSISPRGKNVDLFHKSNSLDSGYKTLSAASHGTSHTDPIDEVNEQFLQIASSPSSCSSSSFVVSNVEAKTPSKMHFLVDEEDGKDSKLNIDAVSTGEISRHSRQNSLSNYSVSNYSVLLNEFCSSPVESVDVQEEKPMHLNKKKSGFATTVATFFSSSKKKDEEFLSVPTNSSKHLPRSSSLGETSTEKSFAHEEMSEGPVDAATDQPIESVKHRPTTTTYTIPSKSVQISTQSLSPSTRPRTINSTPHSSSFSWLSRLSNRFHSSSNTPTTPRPTSSTGLIFENRPNNLPPKSNEETLKHQNEYQKMCFEAKRAQQIFDEKEEQRQRLKFKREEFVSKSLQIWTKEILPRWSEYPSIQLCPDVALNSKASKLWWHGLPPRIRGKVWKMAIGNELGLTYELFSQLEEMAREKLAATKQAEDARSTHSASPQFRTTNNCSETTSTYIELIQLDVSRTFPQLGLFQQNGPYHEYLQLLLCIYVYFCPEIGYVQGQAFLAAMFLLNLDLFDSFLCFANLLHRPYFQTFYRFNNIEKYLQLFSDLLNAHLPKLSAHFQQMSIEANCFALDWFFTIYSKSLPLDVVSRIWDLFFRDGDVFIFRTAIAILSLYEERLCQLDTFHCLQFLTRLPEDLNGTTLFKAIDQIHFDPNSSELFDLIA